MFHFGNVLVFARVAAVVKVEVEVVVAAEVVAKVVLEVSSIHSPNSKLSRPGLYKGQPPCKQDTSQSVKEWSYKLHFVSPPENTWDVFETIQIEIGVHKLLLAGLENHKQL